MLESKVQSSENEGNLMKLKTQRLEEEVKLMQLQIQQLLKANEKKEKRKVEKNLLK